MPIYRRFSQLYIRYKNIDFHWYDNAFPLLQVPTETVKTSQNVEYIYTYDTPFLFAVRVL